MTFTYEGNQITCEFFGTSVVNYDDDSDYSFIFGQSGFGRGAGDPPECKEAIQSLQVGVYYRTEDGALENTSGFTFGDYVSTDGSKRGTLTDVRATHMVVYTCGNDDLCTTSVQTSPK